MKRWPGRPTPVLDGLELVVDWGEAHWVGGRNGAGKTTLLRLLGGLLLPDAGTVRIGALDLQQDRQAAQRSIGHLSAISAGLYNRLTVEQHLELWCATGLVPRRRRRTVRRDVLRRFALEELADRRCDRMSMGQRQRVRLAGALLHDPRCVLLDEPETSLDEEGIAVLHGELDRLRAAGGSIVWAGPAGERTTYPFDARHQLDAGRLIAA